MQRKVKSSNQKNKPMQRKVKSSNQKNEPNSPKNKSNRFMETSVGQYWFMNLMQRLGYPLEPGMCYGFSHMAMRAIVAGEISDFIERMSMINKLNKHLGINTIFKEKIDQDQNARDEFLNKLDEEQKEIILPFFDGVVLYQSAKKFPHLYEFDKAPKIQDASSVHQFTMEIDKEKLLSKIAAFTGIYNKEDLKKYFENSQKVIKKSGTKKPIAFVLLNYNHAITIAYFPHENKWELFDANYYISEEILNAEDFSKKILRAFYVDHFSSNYVTFNTDIYTNDCKLSEFTQANFLLDDIHHVSEDRAKLCDKDNVSWLYTAANFSESKTVDKIIKLSENNINRQTLSGSTPLHIAAQQGHVEVVKLLLNHHEIDVNIQNQHGSTPLHIAALQGHVEVVKLLLKEDEININIEDEDKSTPIYFAAQKGRSEVVKLLLNHHEIDVNIKKFGEYSPLYVAVLQGHVEVVKLLLSVNEMCEKLNIEEFKNLLFIAVKNDNAEMVQFILTKYKVSKTDNLKKNDFKDTLSIAIINDNAKVVDLLIEKYNFSRKSILFFAATNGKQAVVKLLLKKSVDVKHKNDKGLTPLHAAAINGHVEVVKLLLNHHESDVNIQNQRGSTPLHIVAQKGHVEVFKLLLNHHKIDVNIQNQHSRTPLHIAAQQGHVEVFKLLLNHHKIDVNIQDQHSRTPHDIAAKKGHVKIVELLKKTNKIEALKPLQNYTTFSKPLGERKLNGGNSFKNHSSQHAKKRPNQTELNELDKENIPQNISTSHKKNRINITRN